MTLNGIKNMRVLVVVLVFLLSSCFSRNAGINKNASDSPCPKFDLPPKKEAKNSKKEEKPQIEERKLQPKF